MEWLGHAKIDFVHAPAPRAIKEKDGTDTDLLKICEKNTPPCQLNPWLFNGHIQTWWTASKPHGPKVFYRRKVFEAEEKAFRGSYAVDFVVEPHEENDKTLPWRTVYFTDNELKNMGSDDNKPMLVVLHGLSGGSHEVYLRSCIAPLLGEGSWEACVVNSRGCAKSKLTSGLLYNARSTWDLRQTIKWLRKTYPNRPLFALGFSLGANILTNYCGEEGTDCVLKGAVVISNPFNMAISSKVLRNSFLGQEVYLRTMGTTMRELAQAHRKELEMYSDLDMDAVDKVKYLFDFDRTVQCPTWGYPTEDAYYRDSASSDSVLSIRIPFMAIHATDDPIAIKQSIPYEEFRSNPSTVLVTTSLGGHVCWFDTVGTRWYPRPTCNFFNHLAFKVDPTSIKPLQENPFADKEPRYLHYDPMVRKLAVVKD